MRCNEENSNNDDDNIIIVTIFSLILKLLYGKRTILIPILNVFVFVKNTHSFIYFMSVCQALYSQHMGC